MRVACHCWMRNFRRNGFRGAGLMKRFWAWYWFHIQRALWPDRDYDAPFKESWKRILLSSWSLLIVVAVYHGLIFGLLALVIGGYYLWRLL